MLHLKPIWKCLLLLGGLFVCTGAECIPKQRRLAPDVNLDQVIAQINRDTEQIESLSSSNATITASSGGRTFPTIGARLALARPQQLRLVGRTMFTGKELDIGSNQNLFWFWVRRNEPPALYYASHEQFARSRLREQFPINPQWLFEAFGVTYFEPNHQHSGLEKVDGDKLKIVSARPVPGGREYKVTLIDAYQGWVLEQYLYDAQGQLVASALAENHKADPVTGVVLPHTVELTWPPAQLSLKVKLGNLEVNKLEPNNGELFAMPDIEDAPKFNLVQQPPPLPGAVGVPSQPQAPATYPQTRPRERRGLIGRRGGSRPIPLPSGHGRTTPSPSNLGQTQPYSVTPPWEGGREQPPPAYPPPQSPPRRYLPPRQ